MLFSSVTFLGFFLPAVFVLYFIVPSRMWKNSILLFASLLFYAWGEPVYVFLMLGSIMLNYFAALLIARYGGGYKKMCLFVSLCINLGVLFLFKYLGFSCQILNHIIASLHFKPLEIINLALPIGISFYTFQEISYLVDVYKNPGLVQKNPLNLGLYITFFPQLIAGPIVRYHDINLQIESRKESVDKIYSGLQRFIVGLSKKVLLSNNLAYVCDMIYESDFFSYGAGVAWIAALSYALQIYYDFSGYSDMAIGLARIFGFDLLENFNYPYAASSITDFWKRWHISLTNFFRDYVYIPLGGNRAGRVKTALNRFAVFFLTGLWHGAAVNFVFWGLLHGFCMVFERFLKLNKRKNACFSVLYRIITLSVIILLWVLFRNGTVQTVKLWLKMIGVNYTRFLEFHAVAGLPFRWFNIDSKFWIVFVGAVLFSFPWWRKVSVFSSEKFFVFKIVSKNIVLVILFVLCFAFLANNTYNPFIYFRF